MNDESKALATIIRHRDLLRLNMQRLAQDIERRGLDHDLTKLREDEFAGFVRINAAAREHPYGSAEYEAALKSEAGPTGCIGIHFSRNSHHPEFHELTHWECCGCHRRTESEPRESCPVCGYGESCRHSNLSAMGFIDIIEMVMDWKAAADGYGNTPFREGVAKQRDRFKFSESQWWLIEQVVEYLDPKA